MTGKVRAIKSPSAAMYVFVQLSVVSLVDCSLIPYLLSQIGMFMSSYE